LAIYHLRLKVISRALGRAAKVGGATRRSAVAAAAYRSGEKLYDSSQGKWFSFDKPDVIHKEIIAPDNVTVPAWVFDRQTLWNMVERAEKAYAYLKDRLTQWVAVKKRSLLWQEVHQYQHRDPVKLADFLLRLTDMAEDIAAQYKRTTPVPEVPLDR
jgi:hypothetical protein